MCYIRMIVFVCIVQILMLYDFPAGFLMLPRVYLPSACECHFGLSESDMIHMHSNSFSPCIQPPTMFSIATACNNLLEVYANAGVAKQ
jgi:hypothetical protein